MSNSAYEYEELEEILDELSYQQHDQVLEHFWGLNARKNQPLPLAGGD